MFFNQDEDSLAEESERYSKPPYHHRNYRWFHNLELFKSDEETDSEED